jgi:hypothetical protein
MSNNPLEDDPARDARIREVAYHLWEADGCPHHRDLEYWERARELVGMEESRGAGQISPAADDAHRVDGQIVDEAAAAASGVRTANTRAQSRGLVRQRPAANGPSVPPDPSLPPAARYFGISTGLLPGGILPVVPGGGMTGVVPACGGGTIIPGSVFAGGRTTPAFGPAGGLTWIPGSVCGAGAEFDGLAVCARAGRVPADRTATAMNGIVRRMGLTMING